MDSKHLKTAENALKSAEVVIVALYDILVIKAAMKRLKVFVTR